MREYGHAHLELIATKDGEEVKFEAFKGGLKTMKWDVRHQQWEDDGMNVWDISIEGLRHILEWNHYPEGCDAEKEAATFKHVLDLHDQGWTIKCRMFEGTV